MKTLPIGNNIFILGLFITLGLFYGFIRGPSAKNDHNLWIYPSEITFSKNMQAKLAKPAPVNLPIGNNIFEKHASQSQSYLNIAKNLSILI